MPTTPILFSGWDAYKFTPLMGTFEVRVNDRWLPYEMDVFSCALTYRFTPEETRMPVEIAAEQAAEAWFLAGSHGEATSLRKMYFIDGFKEGAVWHARERAIQETKRTAAQQKREQQEQAYKQSGEALWADKKYGDVLCDRQAPPILARDPEQDYVKLQESIRTDA